MVPPDRATAHRSPAHLRPLLFGLLVGTALGVPLFLSARSLGSPPGAPYPLPSDTTLQPPLATGASRYSDSGAYDDSDSEIDVYNGSEDDSDSDSDTAGGPQQASATGAPVPGGPPEGDTGSDNASLLSHILSGRGYANLLHQLGAYHTALGLLSRVADAAALSPSALLAPPTQKESPSEETPSPHFPRIVRKCIRLLEEYDRLSSEVQWRKSTDFSSPYAAALARVASTLQKGCGVSLRGAERGSLDRARQRHLQASCGAAASATAVRRYSCLPRTTMARAYPEAVADPYIQSAKSSPISLVWPSPWLGESICAGPLPAGKQRREGTGGVPREGERESQLSAIWPVWRRGAGTQTAASMKAKGSGSSLEPSFQDSEPLTVPPGTYEGVSWLQQYATGTHVAPRVSENAATLSVMIQYYKQKEESVAQVVDRYASCRHRRPRRGPGVELPEDRDGWLEVLANVDRPGEARAWMKLWRKFFDERFPDSGPPHGGEAQGWEGGEARGTPEGGEGEGEGEGGGRGRAATSFLFVQFQHNLHENRGYDTLAQVARGKVVMMTQGDDVAPKDCVWTHRILRQFEAHDGVGTVGYNTAVRLARAPNGGPRGHVYLYPFQPEWMDVDPPTRSLASVVHLVDIGPMSALRCLWDQIGGMDAAWGPLGQAGIISDWHFSQHTWMAGFRVKHVYQSSLIRENTEAGGQTHVPGSKSKAIRLLNHGPNEGAFWETEVHPFSQTVANEVKRSYQTVHPPDYIFGQWEELYSLIHN